MSCAAIFSLTAAAGLASPISTTPDPGFWGVDGIVYAIVRVGDVVYLGGDFVNLVSPNGSKTLQAKRLAALDVHTGQPTNWRPMCDNTVMALAASPDGSTIYVGGSFHQIDGASRDGFAAIGTDGDLKWTASCNSRVRSIAVSGNTIYLGGTFTSVLGQTRLRVAAIRPPSGGGNTAQLLPWSPSISGGAGWVNSVLVANGDVVAMGAFSSASGHAEACQARFDAVTGAWKPWDDNEDRPVKSGATDGTNYYGALGGGGGRVVAWGPTGNKKWHKQGDGDAQCIGLFAGLVIAGGHYGMIDGTTIRRLTSLDPTTGAIDTSWFPDPDLGGELGPWVIYAGEKLHVGGSFRKMKSTVVRGYSQFSLTDSVPPSVPANLTATAINPTQVELSWRASTDNRGVSGYEVFRDGSLLATIGPVTTYSDTSVVQLTTYSYRVRARDSVGNVSGLSNTATVTTLTDVDPPSRPLSLRAIAIGPAQVDLSWRASTDNFGVTGYTIFRDGAELMNVGSVTNFSDTSVIPGTTYDYVVRARDAVGNFSEASSVARVRTPSDLQDPTVPSNLVATASDPARINLRWDASSDNVRLVGYEIFRGGLLLTSVGTVTNFSDTPLTPLTAYSYQVRAKDLAGNLSDPSNIASATTPADTQKPTTPASLIAAAFGSTRVDLRWKPSTDNVAVAGYQVFRNNRQIASIAAVTNWSDTTVAPSRSYTYKVRAFDPSGNRSSFSNQKSVSTPSRDRTPPSAPSNLNATAISATQINLKWKAATDNRKVVGYDIFRNGLLLTNAPAAITYSDMAVKPLTGYSYQVKARDADGNISPPSNTASATTPADTTAPSAVSNLVATGVSSTQADLAWNAATDNVCVTGYDICRDGAVIAWIGATTNYPDMTASPTTAYSYCVKARDAAGNVSGPSNTANVATPDTQPPSVPTGLTATAADPTQVDLAWNPSADDVAVAAYDIYRDGNFLADIGTATNYTDSTVSPTTTYVYHARARDAAGNVSDSSNAADATTPADTTPPTAPGGLIALPMSGTQIGLAWSASVDNLAVTSYDIYRGGGLIASIGTTSSYSDLTVSPATTHQYQVVARDDAGNVSDPSDTASANTPDTLPPGAPSDLTTTALSATQVFLEWTAAADNVAVTGYEVFRDGSLLATIGAVTEYYDGTVGPLITCNYELRARDAAGNVSDPSNNATVVTPPDTTPPSAPTNLNAVATGWLQIDLVWEESTDDVGVTAYHIYRDGAWLATTSVVTNYSDTTASPFTIFEYQATAEDEAGNQSDPSDTATVTTEGDTEPPSPPTGLSATAGNSTQVDLVWTASTDDFAVSGYDIYRDGAFVDSVVGTTYSDTSVGSASTYGYEVYARDAAGHVSAASNTAIVTTP